MEHIIFYEMCYEIIRFPYPAAADDEIEWHASGTYAFTGIILSAHQTGRKCSSAYPCSSVTPAFRL